MYNARAFFIVEENIFFVLKMHWSTLGGAVKVYRAGFVTHDRSIGY
jgi:hypothetical protein